MSKGIERFNIGLGSKLLEKMTSAMNTTHYNTPPDLIRVAVAVLIDLLDALDQGMQIIFKSTDGTIYSYNPHNPGRIKYRPPNKGKEESLFISNKHPIDDGKTSSRFTIGFTTKVMKEVDWVTETTQYRSVQQIVKAALLVVFDLMAARELNLEVLFKDEKGQYYQYSLDLPGKARPVANSSHDNVIILNTASKGVRGYGGIASHGMVINAGAVQK